MSTETNPVSALDRCSHAVGEVCRCADNMTCVCPPCCAQRWPDAGIDPDAIFALWDTAPSYDSAMIVAGRFLPLLCAEVDRLREQVEDHRLRLAERDVEVERLRTEVETLELRESLRDFDELDDRG